MLKYKILRWDPVMFGNSINKYPLITIKPDDKFVTFSNANKSSVSCEITVNNVTHTFDGVVNKSSDVPNCRPNYFAATGNYVITLMTEWRGYPKNSDLKNLGTITFSPIIDGTVKLQTPEYKTILSNSSDSKKCDGTECNDVNYKGPCPCDTNKTNLYKQLGIVAGVFLFVGIVALSVWFYTRRQSKQPPTSV